jgi:hypothetical protein
VLLRTVSADERSLRRTKFLLALAQTLVFRLVTEAFIPRLALSVENIEDRLDLARAELEGCFIEVDFGLNQQALASYSLLSGAFSDLSNCARIWDITSTSAINRVKARTVATTAVRRTPVHFTLVRPTVVRVAHDVPQLGVVGGRDIQLFPSFVMMRDKTSDFALIEYKDFHSELTRTRFVEDESVPSDSQVLGQTWKKSNKDGSRDKRFKENYSIPIVEYGEIELKSTTGLLESYQFSNFSKSEQFARALDVHKRALNELTLTGSGPDAVPPADALPPTEDDIETDEPRASLIKPRTNLWLDWTVLVVALVGSGATLLLQGHPS